MNNISILKDIYQIIRNLFASELKDKEIASLFEFRYFKDGIKYFNGQNSIPIALVFGDNTFLGIVTPFGRFEYKLAIIYRKEYLDSLIEKANTLFGATEVPALENRFSSFTWINPKVFALKKLPWEKENLPLLTFANNKEEQVNEEVLKQVYNDWNTYVEKIKCL